MKRRHAALAGLALTLAGSLFLACGEGTPVAPSTSILRISAYPTRIGKTGTSAITVSAYRTTGDPVNPGTEVRLTSNLGVVDPVIYTDDAGVAQGTLRGDGRIGAATSRMRASCCRP